MRQVIIFTSFLFVCMLYGCAGVESRMVPMTHEKSPEVETSRGIDTDLLSRYQTKYPEDESNNIIPGGHYELFYRRNGGPRWASRRQRIQCWFVVGYRKRRCYCCAIWIMISGGRG